MCAHTIRCARWKRRAQKTASTLATLMVTVTRDRLCARGNIKRDHCANCARGNIKRDHCARGNIKRDHCANCARGNIKRDHCARGNIKRECAASVQDCAMRKKSWCIGALCTGAMIRQAVLHKHATIHNTIWYMDLHRIKLNDETK
jgi:hypothetical protein